MRLAISTTETLTDLKTNLVVANNNNNRLRVSPSMFGLMFMGSVMVSICSSSCVLYSAGSGVKRLHDVLSGLRMRLVVCVHVCISCRTHLFLRRCILR